MYQISQANIRRNWSVFEGVKLLLLCRLYIVTDTFALAMEEIIAAFKINTEAIATNRGFYFQYLITLEKWLTNFIEGKDVETLVEVQEDIKEVGEKLLFTQVKCYSSDFNLNSDEIRNTLANFYILFLENKASIEQLEFLFYTNTEIKQREKLLLRWIDDPQLSNTEIKALCVKKVKEILKKEFKTKRDHNLQKQKVTSDDKVKIRNAFEQLKLELDSPNLIAFVESLKWHFGKESPEDAISKSENRILQVLSDEQFRRIPANLLINVFLSEIYRKSTQRDPVARKLNNSDVEGILDHSHTAIVEYVDSKFITLIGTKEFEIQRQIDELTKKTEANSSALEELKSIQSDVNVKLPKELNFLPYFYSNDFFGRDEDLNEIDNQLGNGILCIHSIGGIGKTALAKAFLDRKYNSYDHIIWICRASDLKKEFVQDEILIKNLGIKFNETTSVDQRYDVLINQLNQVSGKNIIVIDNVVDESYSTSHEINKISTKNWDVLATSRNKISRIKIYPLRTLHIDNVRELIKSNCEKAPNEETLVEFLELIDYNTLMIELSAKTIQSSVDLDFKKLIQYLSENRLDSKDLEIDIETEIDSNETNLFSNLQSTFKLINLTEHERYMLDLLGVLSSEEFPIKEFIEVNNFLGNNDLQLVTNMMNSLDKKGWIEKNGPNIKVHRLIQEVIKYNYSNYAGYAFLISAITYQIDEANKRHPASGIRFIKHSEAILKSIKGDRRVSVEQPLLMLENNVLETRRMLGEIDYVHSARLKLTARAENYLEEDDFLLGVIYMNMGVSYRTRGEKELAIEYIEKAIPIFEKGVVAEEISDKKRKGLYRYLLMAIDNLATFQAELGLTKKALFQMKRSLEIRSEYDDTNDPMYAGQLNTLASFFMRARDYDKAIENLQMAIILHKEAKVVDKNDLWLANYYSNLSTAYFLKFDTEPALKYQLEAIKIMEGMELFDNPDLAGFYLLTSIIYREVGELELSERYAIKAQKKDFEASKH